MGEEWTGDGSEGKWLEEARLTWSMVKVVMKWKQRSGSGASNSPRYSAPIRPTQLPYLLIPPPQGYTLTYMMLSPRLWTCTAPRVAAHTLSSIYGELYNTGFRYVHCSFNRYCIICVLCICIVFEIHERFSLSKIMIFLITLLVIPEKWCRKSIHCQLNVVFNNPIFSHSVSYRILSYAAGV